MCSGTLDKEREYEFDEEVESRYVLGSSLGYLFMDQYIIQWAHKVLYSAFVSKLSKLSGEYLCPQKT